MRGGLTGLTMAGGLILALAESQVSAQEAGFALDRLEPTPAGDAFFAVPTPAVEGHRQLTAGLYTDLAHAPLVLRSATEPRDYGRIVSSRMNLRLQVALTLAGRLLVDLEAPFAVLNTGDSPTSPRGTRFPSPDGPAAGDLRAGARLRALSRAGERLQLAVASALWLPTGRRAQYTGDGGVRAVAMAIAGGVFRDRLLWTTNLGFRARGETVLANNVVAKELLLAAAGGVLFASRRMLLGAELWGAGPLTDRADFFDARSSAAEALIGFHYRGRTVTLAVGGGPGLSRAMGTPDARLVARFAYAPREPEPLPPPPPAPAAPIDRDGDGIFDPDDACPLVAGVRHEDPRKNGCPPDRDQDRHHRRARTPARSCRACRIRIPRKTAARPIATATESSTARTPARGRKGPRDPDPAKNGCPTLVRVTEREIVILRKIHFEFNKARIMPDSSELLAQVAQVLKEHPEIHAGLDRRAHRRAGWGRLQPAAFAATRRSGKDLVDGGGHRAGPPPSPRFRQDQAGGKQRHRGGPRAEPAGRVSHPSRGGNALTAHRIPFPFRAGLVAAMVLLSVAPSLGPLPPCGSTSTPRAATS